MFAMTMLMWLLLILVVIVIDIVTYVLFIPIMGIVIIDTTNVIVNFHIVNCHHRIGIWHVLQRAV